MRFSSMDCRQRGLLRFHDVSVGCWSSRTLRRKIWNVRVTFPLHCGVLWANRLALAGRDHRLIGVTFRVSGSQGRNLAAKSKFAPSGVRLPRGVIMFGIARSLAAKPAAELLQ